MMKLDEKGAKPVPNGLSLGRALTCSSLFLQGLNLFHRYPCSTLAPLSLLNSDSLEGIYYSH
jgi:hypothetical protein